MTNVSGFGTRYQSRTAENAMAPQPQPTRFGVTLQIRLRQSAVKRIDDIPG